MDNIKKIRFYDKKNKTELGGFSSMINILYVGAVALSSEKMVMKIILYLKFVPIGLDKLI
uniref:Uncharacterized protein n=1 Tax=Siphoviridae sp. ctTnV63 TaxID=2825523 RepID=A0A8S5NWL7_9CAUD|nr:MAG TPA: hypothetical protein [Siphoviridae sp. ctTnV63]